MKPFENIPMPQGMAKKEILEMLLREEYGYLPEKPLDMTVETVSTDHSFCAGKADLIKLKFVCKLACGEFSFPVYYTKRNVEEASPCFIHINFRPDVPDRYQPTEEIVDKGYNVLSFCYQDVSKDNGDFTDGLAGVVYSNGMRGPHDGGKIALWAWAAMRVMDHAMTLPELRHDRISVAGHSRLGKTALLTGALDARFYCAFSNDSGCSGAAISREKQGETIAKIVKTFPYWFCENYKKYADNEDALPFDQHFLLAANSPHHVYVASAMLDAWADPENEYAACELAAPYFEAQGLSPEKYIGYHIRDGKHYFSREDWNRFFEHLAKIEG